MTLLDMALPMAPAQRDLWLKDMAPEEPGVMRLLHKLLAAHGRVEAQDILATLPKLQRIERPIESGAVGMQLGPFELVALLGRGGMGSVWRARYADGRLKRDVAVKLPAMAGDPAGVDVLRARFDRERDFLAQLQHRHIARLYDAGVSESGQPFLAMEYVVGMTIDEHCDAKRLTIKARLQIFMQVLDAVAYAHQQLVLHRDLKTGNVLVDEQGQVRLLDFGVARLMPTPQTEPLRGADSDVSMPGIADLTERAGAAFTLGYAAPEQVSHAALSTATDVYALGVMLFRLLTGLSPYQPVRDTRGSLEDAVMLVTPQMASARSYTPAALTARQCQTKTLRATLRGDLDLILAKALKKDPGERYPTVAALNDDLRRHLARQPITAMPDSWWYRSSRFVARNRAAVGASTLAALAVAATAGVAAWQAHVSTLNAERAVKEAARAHTSQKFFAGLLSNADPEKNKNITAVDRQVVDQALATAEKELATTPETLALVLKQLGEIYTRFDVPAKLLEVQRKRVDLLESLPQRQVDDYVDAHIELARALSRSVSAEERSQALPRAMAAHELAVTHHASAGLAVTALCLVADLHAAVSNDREAHEFATRAVATAERSKPVPFAELALAHAQQGITFGRLGDFDRARKAFRDSLAIDMSDQGRGKVEQIHTRMVLANMEFDAGRYEASRHEALSVIAFASERVGEMDGTLGPVRYRAVLATLGTGDFPAAWEMAQRLLPADMRASDPTRAAFAHLAFGMAAMFAGRLDEAEKSYLLAEPGAAIRPRLATSLAARRAELNLRRGQPAQARDALRLTLESARAKGPPYADEQVTALERDAVALARLGQSSRAEATFAEACSGRRAKLPASHPSRIRCEAYTILISDQQAAPAKREALAARMVGLQAANTGRTALSASLGAARDRLSSPSKAERLSNDFPLFD